MYKSHHFTVIKFIRKQGNFNKNNNSIKNINKTYYLNLIPNPFKYQ